MRQTNVHGVSKYARSFFCLARPFVLFCGKRCYLSPVKTQATCTRGSLVLKTEAARSQEQMLKTVLWYLWPETISFFKKKSRRPIWHSYKIKCKLSTSRELVWQTSAVLVGVSCRSMYELCTSTKTALANRHRHFWMPRMMRQFYKPKRGV
jgi:hypothetical protein